MDANNILLYSNTKSFKTDLIVSLKGQCHKLFNLRVFMNNILRAQTYWRHFDFVQKLKFP
jgi:hypothetical protein